MRYNWHAALVTSLRFSTMRGGEALNFVAAR